MLKLRPFNGMLVHELIADERAHRRVGGVEQRRAAFHGDALDCAADLQRDIESRLLVGFEYDPVLVNRGESTGLDADIVGSRLERGDGIEALLIGGGAASCAGVGVRNHNTRAGHGETVGIEDVAVHGAGGRALRRRNRGQQKKCEGRDNQFPVGHTFASRINFVIWGNHTLGRGRC